MFPANLDTKDGQAAAIKAIADWQLASLGLSDATRYATMAAAHKMATSTDADHWLDEATRHLDAALAAIGYRMVPVDQPTPEEARRLALEEAEKAVLASARKSLGVDSYSAGFEDGCACQNDDDVDAIRALISEPSK